MTGQLLTTSLSAECLWSKHGFMDGSPFEFEDRGPGYDDEPSHADWTLLRETMNSRQRADLLELLVRQLLLPAIALATGRTPDLVRIQTHHNPVRDARLDHANQDDIPEGWLDISVEATPDEVRRAALTILTRTP